jgi:hypothetical protein
MECCVWSRPFWIGGWLVQVGLLAVEPWRVRASSSRISACRSGGLGGGEIGMVEPLMRGAYPPWLRRGDQPAGQDHSRSPTAHAGGPGWPSGALELSLDPPTPELLAGLERFAGAV